jgi:hypothetical protein
MARKVYFSFHYEQDIWRTNVVRNHWVTQGYGETGVIDASLWEEAKKKGDAAIAGMIDEGLEGTTATVVLIGAETSERPWVKYEILQSLRRNNAIIAIHINRIKNQDSQTCTRGRNPLIDIVVLDAGQQVRLSTICPVYDWVMDDGFNNLGKWVETAVSEVKDLRPSSQMLDKSPSFSDLLKQGDARQNSGLIVKISDKYNYQSIDSHNKRFSKHGVKRKRIIKRRRHEPPPPSLTRLR